MSVKAPSTGGGAPAGAPDKAQKWLKIGAAVFVAVALVFAIIHFAPRLFGKGEKEDVQRQTSSAVQTAVSSPTVKGRVIQAAVICPSFSMERQTCTFDHESTAGFGSTVAGKHFCYDKPYGPEYTYSRDRWDATQQKWMPWSRDEDPGVVYEQRLRGNIAGAPVSVTYWLQDTPC